MLAARGLAAAVSRDGVRPPSTAIVRVLGARQLAQGVVTVAAPEETSLLLGAVVDALHAASMVPFIAFSSRLRRPAAVSASLAAVSAAAGFRLATTEGS